MNVVLNLCRSVTAVVGLLCLMQGQTWALDVGDKAPACLLKQLNNSENALDLKQLQGQALYIDFWASWCGPCIKSFPYMSKVEKKFKKQSFKVIAINLDEDIDDAKSFLKKMPVDFSTVIDENQNCAKAFDVKAMPSSYLVNRQGIIQHVHLGFRPGELNELEEQLKKIVQSSPVSQIDSSN